MNEFMEILGALGYLLDTPGAYTRGMIAGRPGERVSGREMLEAYGLGANQEGLDLGDVLGFGADVLVDPLNFMTMPLAGLKAARAASKVGKNRQVAKGIAEGTLIPREQLARSAYPGPVYRLKPELGAPEEFFTDYLDALRAAEANAVTGVRSGTPELAKAFGVDDARLTNELQSRIYDAAPDMLQKRYIDVRNPIDLQEGLTRAQAVQAGTEPADIGAMYKDVFGLETTPEAIKNKVEKKLSASLLEGVAANEAESFLFQTPLARATEAVELARRNVQRANPSSLGLDAVNESVAALTNSLDDAAETFATKILDARRTGRMPYEGFNTFDPPFGGQAARQLEEEAIDAVMRSMKLEPSDRMIARHYGMDYPNMYRLLPRDYGGKQVDDYAEYARRLGGDSFVSTPIMSQIPNPIRDNWSNLSAHTRGLMTSPGDMFGVLDNANVYEDVAPAMVNPRMFDAAMYGTGAVGAEALEALYPERGPMEIERQAYPLTMGMMP